MKIYTKTGDAGTTSLVGGTRVSKAHPRVMTYGDLDELISCIGLLRCETASAERPAGCGAESGGVSANSGTPATPGTPAASGTLATPGTPGTPAIPGTPEELPLRRIQIHLMNVSAHLANDGRSTKLKPLDEGETAFLEQEIDRMTALLPPQTAFVLPGTPHASSLAHMARTICRRAERSAVQIEDKTEQDIMALKYVNRLSDYLFTLARYLCAGHDDFWLP